jgi:NAD-dependent dihydropyrimidine dehydrogenase PreA subunit
MITVACTACGICLWTCGEGALLPAPRRPVVLGSCTACGDCIEICPRGAILEAAHAGPGPAAKL